MNNLNELYQNLKKEFDIIYFDDLAEVTVSHGEVFHLFKKLYQPKFESNQRIIFYSSQIPEQLILNHIQRAATKIGINNCIIAFYGSHDISHQLELANKKFGNSEVAIEFKLYDLPITKPLTAENIHVYDTLCPMPYMSVLQINKKQVLPCCKYQELIGDLSKNTIKDIFYGNTYQQLRNDLKKGIKSKHCEACWHVESLGGTSLRKSQLRSLENETELEYIDKPKVQHLNVKPSTLCNFKCRICSSANSTQIAAELHKFATNVNQKKIIIQKSKERQFEYDEFLTAVDPILDDLESIDFVGGEPTVVPHFPLFLQHLINRGLSSQIKIFFHTNGSVWNEECVASLKKFKKVHILLSIDDIGARFEVQRGGSWPEVEKNILKYAALRNENINVTPTCTINIQNVLYLDELLSYMQKIGLNMIWEYLDYPYVFCIDNLTTKAKELVYNKYHNHENPRFREIAVRIKKSSGVDGSEFINVTGEYDRRRQTSFSESHAEIYEAMKTKQDCDKEFKSKYWDLQ